MMHILLALLGAIGGIAAILWRLHMIAEASKGLADSAGSARGAFRRWRWRRKLNTDLLAEIHDPREAAAIMMCAIAAHDGVMTDKAQKRILTLVMQNFDTTGDQAGELLAIGRGHTRDIGDLTSFLRRLTPSIDKNVGAKERQDLLEMLRNVAAANGKPDDIVLSAIENLRHHFTKLG